MTRPKLADITADHDRLTPLMSAALEGNTNEVRALLKLGVDINAQDSKGFTALMLAVVNRQIETVKTLLGEGGDMNIQAGDGTTALSIAASSGDGSMMRVLLNHRASKRPTNAVRPRTVFSRPSIVTRLTIMRWLRGNQ